MGPPTAVVTLACYHAPTTTNDPAANPYRIEFAIALGLLLGVFILWRYVRPPARQLLRSCAATSGAVAFWIMNVEACFGRDHVDAVVCCLLVLKASLVVAASLLFEILPELKRRSDFPHAVARKPRTRGRS